MLYMTQEKTLNGNITYFHCGLLTFSGIVLYCTELYCTSPKVKETNLYDQISMFSLSRIKLIYH